MKAIVKYGGERLDRIARTLLGTEQGGGLVALLTANPGLAATSVHAAVSEGTEVEAPEDFDATPPRDDILAWE